MDLTSLFSIALGAILINNFIFAQFLGCCPFLGHRHRHGPGRHLRYGLGLCGVLGGQ